MTDDLDVDTLVEAARQAALGSYSPYSRYRVGAVAVDDQGQCHTGANVENAAYGSAICAEATAIAGAVAGGVRKIEALVVACIDAVDITGTHPCGNCRQLMNEFGVERVIVTGAEGEVREYAFEELHPHGFVLPGH